MLARTPEDPRALHGLARAQRAMGDSAAALETYRELARIDPDFLQRASLRGRCLAWTDEIDRLAMVGDARAVLELAAAHDSGGCPPSATAGARVAAHESLAREAERAVRSNEAIAHWLAAAEADPTRADPIAEAAERMLDLGRTDAAVELLQAGLERHPRSRRLQRLMVRALAGDADPAPAEDP